MDMKMIILLLFLGVVCVQSGRVTEKNPSEDILNESSDEKVFHWDYATNGPSTWGKHASKDCDGNSQSPINIVTCETARYGFNNRVFRHNYWSEFTGKYKMSNNGHALQIDFPKNNNYYLMKGHKKYTPLQVHIHFDPLTGKGSEHTLNSRKYFAEIHIVHKRSSYPGETFMKKPDGLLVIGIFVDLVKGFRNHHSSELDFKWKQGQVQTPNNRNSFAMSMFAKVASELVEPKTHKMIDPFPLAWLLPKVHRKHSTLSYVNYRGSLTTPPCSEIVDWIVITGKTLEINEKLAQVFKHVQNSNYKPMAGNNRPLQDLNGREVYGVTRSF